MTCNRCGKDFDETEARCPHCGEAQAGASGLFQTSTVLISSGGSDLVYRTVEEVPRGLRTRLLKSTSGGNSGIILIADRRGRKEIAKVVGELPGGRKRAGWPNVRPEARRCGRGGAAAGPGAGGVGICPPLAVMVEFL